MRDSARGPRAGGFRWWWLLVALVVVALVVYVATGRHGVTGRPGSGTPHGVAPVNAAP
jgi:hypothetical protein